MPEFLSEYIRELRSKAERIRVDFVPKLVKADFTKDFDNCEIPSEIKKAVILHHGKLTPDYQYIDRYI